MPQSSTKHTLIGGPSHGKVVRVDDSAASVEVQVLSSDDDPSSVVSVEIYTRREFTTAEPGTRKVWFGHDGDDNIDTEALAGLLESETSGTMS